MDEYRKRRGELLLEKEDIEREIEGTERRISEVADNFMRLGNELKSRPERFIFKNVPSGTENRVPDLLQDQPAFDWSLCDCHAVLRLTSQLREYKGRLRSVTAELAMDMTNIRVSR